MWAADNTSESEKSDDWKLYEEEEDEKKAKEEEEEGKQQKINTNQTRRLEVLKDEFVKRVEVEFDCLPNYRL
jgi:protein subunit release factor B